MNGDITERVDDYLITESVLPVRADIGEVLRILRSQKTSGTLKLELRDGGVRRIALQEKTKPLKISESDQVRKILGMK